MESRETYLCSLPLASLSEKNRKGKKKVTKSFSVVQITALCPADLSGIYFLVLYLVLSEPV